MQPIGKPAMRTAAAKRASRPTSWKTAAAAALSAWFACGTPALARAAATGCAGDCSNDGVVSVDEVVRGVNLALGAGAMDDCPAMDRDGSGGVTVDEVIGAVNAALDGCPATGTATPTMTVAATPTPTAANHPPAIAAQALYRTYPDIPIRLPIAASDVDGNGLRFEAAQLPAGAALEARTGVLTWTPTAAQVGAYTLHFTVTDDGEPPATAAGTLPIKVSPADACTLATCEPAVGCDSALVSLQTACCTGEPPTRVAEPPTGCPGARVLFVGRNERGFGRLQNCDKLQVISFAQGGLTVRFHVETRCVNAARPVTIAAKMSIRDAVLFDDRQQAVLQPREDGFLQKLALIYPVNPAVSVDRLEGAEADLEVRVIDADGTASFGSVRLTLTFQPLGDLPEPDAEEIPAGEAGCIGCHRPIGASGHREGIEEAHPWSPLTCTDCHGGNATATTRAAAHVDSGGAPPFLKNLAADQLDQVPLDYLRFVNPGDLRVAPQTCGRSGCHTDHARNVPLSTMTTYGGHYTLPRYLAGTQDRAAVVAATDVVDPDFDPRVAPIGAISALRALREPAIDADRTSIGTAIDVYLGKSCPTCHLIAFGSNNSAGNYRSSGCTACHMPYDNDGLSRSADPRIRKDFPPHPVRHQLTSAIPNEQCAHCHFQGGRIGLAYRGIREGGFDAAHTPPNAVPIGTPLHAHDANYYFTDEDRTNDFDETPPDLHATAGLVCGDCHVGGDVHGDGRLYSSERHQVGVRCEDCHGTVRAEIKETVADGRFRTFKGAPLRRLRRAEDDRILLKLLMTGEEIEVPQIHRILEAGYNPLMNEAMGVDANGFSHTDRLECYTCHNAWRQTCFGCHVNVDDSRSAQNKTTGLTSQGAITVSRDSYSIDFFAMGTDHRGKLTPLCNSMSVFVSYTDAAGKQLYKDRVRTSWDGKVGFGWNPFQPHTTSRVPLNCDRCHPVAPGSGPDNSALLRETYGFGNGTVLTRDGDGVTHDLTAFLDERGNLRSDFPHPNTGPVPRDVRERALSIPVVPHPR